MRLNGSEEDDVKFLAFLLILLVVLVTITELVLQ
jgi:hypothetical protein